MFNKYVSYIFYLIGIFAGYLASYELLLQLAPNHGIVELAGWFVVTAMFFPLAPLYPGIVLGKWTYAIVCFTAIAIGVMFGNKARKLKA
ncbi:MAG: hypothetical protein VX864_02450 [Pseudomonadota bacterium]|mgnify:FL=1|nr:hypothetical protein [Pseudomonadota bacterium]MEC8996663.1 hypothetical protein [Pseudomonadota bacterium]MED5275014.1 hypothetical protein [Pseudomonadota bacterium]MED5430234.1 hypothetical protein [Pseudomonadota bacterium]|tara:strand:- start:739 stop:1005 length:267 start_codon:yes stop_codon:yes gene_type:complete